MAERGGKEKVREAMSVSVVLPVYKGRFLREAIASILAQTYRAFELVVVDDCSPDDVKTIVDAFADPRISYYRNETNIGGRDLVAAWRRALALAAGEWIVLAGDDDVYRPRFLEELVRLTEKYPQVDLVRSRVRSICADGSVLGVAPARRELESAVELLYDRIVCGLPQFVPEFMFRRARFERIGGFVSFPKAWYADDATWFLMARENGCANCGEPLYSFRCSGLNISTSCRQVLELVRSGLMYRDWLSRQLDGWTPAEADEREMLRAVRARLDAYVLSVICGEMCATSLREWWRVMRTLKMPPGWKRRILRRTAVNRCIKAGRWLKGGCR